MIHSSPFSLLSRCDLGVVCFVDVSGLPFLLQFWPPRHCHQPPFRGCICGDSRRDHCLQPPSGCHLRRSKHNGFTGNFFPFTLCFLNHPLPPLRFCLVWAFRCYWYLVAEEMGVASPPVSTLYPLWSCTVDSIP